MYACIYTFVVFAIGNKRTIKFISTESLKVGRRKGKKTSNDFLKRLINILMMKEKCCNQSMDGNINHNTVLII